MKVKLLKKVRKRFEIFHMPNGFISRIDNTYYNYNLYCLYDNDLGRGHQIYAQLGVKYSTDNYYTDDIFKTEKECIDFLKSEIIKRLRFEGYKGRKDNHITNSIKKVW